MTLDIGNLITDIGTNVTSLMGSLAPVITLLGGILLAFLVINFILAKLGLNIKDDSGILD
jgi:hypothetical protein